MTSNAASECPSNNLLLQYLGNDLPDAEREAIEAHIRTCLQCSEVIKQHAANLAATKVQSTQEQPIQPTTIKESTSGQGGNLPAEVAVGHTLGDFYLVQALGTGSFAKVFLARQETLQWLVALKVTQRETDEAPAMARLDHEHIVRIHGQYVLPEEQLLLVSTKYIPGGTLEDVIRQTQFPTDRPTSGRNLLKVVDGILDARGESKPTASAFRQQLSRFDWPETVCWIGAKLASALDHAHERGVLHRDVKPANVLVTAEGSPMLADFNISFSAEVKGSEAGTFFGGSLLYMSPEQLAACDPADPQTPSELDGRTDIYSLGLLLWELLTGEHPFVEDLKTAGGKANIKALASSRRRGLPDAALSQLPLHTPPGLKYALLKCLEPQASHRFPRAGELAGVLQKQLVPRMRDLLVPPAHSWRNWVIRHPFLVVVMAALFTNLLLTPINIALNVRGIIDQEGVDQLLPAERDAFWDHLMPLINAVVWPLPTIFLIAYAWPMLRGVKRRRESGAADADVWTHCGPRTLRLGLVCSLVIFAAWLLTGIAFPLGIDWAVSGGKLHASHYLQFIVSQAMHALIAASGTYFLVTFLCVRACYPRLIPDQVPRSTAQRDLTLVQRCSVVYLAALGISPLLAIVALATIFWNKSPELRFVFVWLALLGELGFLMGWTISEKLKPDLETLRAAVRPGEDFFRTAGH